MHAALLLATLFFGAPVLPHGDAGDPAAELQDADADILAPAYGLLRLGEQLLRSEDLSEYLRTLDLAVLEFELTPWFAILGAPEAVRQALDETPGRREAVDALVQAVDQPWRTELRDGIESALRLLEPETMNHPVVQRGMNALTSDSLDFSELLGDPDRPPSLRHALLAYIRGFLGITVLAVAADHGTQLPPWMADAVIPPWRACLQQLRHVLSTHEFDPNITTDPDHDNSVASVLTTYQCREGRRLAPYFRRDPELAKFLQITREKLGQFFPDNSTERIWLAPGHDSDGTDDHPGLEITVFTHQDPDAARDALTNFDATWWLDHGDRRTRIVLDAHLV